jgi:hypothetical protein
MFQLDEVRAPPEETTQSSDLNFPVWKIGSSSPQEDKSNAGAFLVGLIGREGEKGLAPLDGRSGRS